MVRNANHRLVGQPKALHLHRDSDESEGLAGANDVGEHNLAVHDGPPNRVELVCSQRKLRVHPGQRGERRGVFPQSDPVKGLIEQLGHGLALLRRVQDPVLELHFYPLHLLAGDNGLFHIHVAGRIPRVTANGQGFEVHGRIHDLSGDVVPGAVVVQTPIKLDRPTPVFVGEL